MDQLLFHPKIVHLPLALAVLMPLIAGGVLLACWRGWLDRGAWVGVVLLQAVLVGSGAIAMNTGEREEDRVEEVVAEEHIDAHEEVAEYLVWASGVVLVLMALPLVLPEGPARRMVSVVALFGTLVVFRLGYDTGEAGGRLVYEHGAAQVYMADGDVSDVESTGDESQEEEQEEEDDDSD